MNFFEQPHFLLHEDPSVDIADLVIGPSPASKPAWRSNERKASLASEFELKLVKQGSFRTDESTHENLANSPIQLSRIYSTERAQTSLEPLSLPQKVQVEPLPLLFDLNFSYETGSSSPVCKLGDRRPLYKSCSQLEPSAAPKQVQRHLVEARSEIKKIKVVGNKESALGQEASFASSTKTAASVEQPPKGELFKKREGKCRQKDAQHRKTPGFKRANDVQYLHDGFDELERRLLELKSVGRATGAESKQKQRLWNQVSSLKARLRTREEALTLMSLARLKDTKAEMFLAQLKHVATPTQLELISQKTAKMWKEAENKAESRWPIDIREEGTLLKGKLRPSAPLSQAKGKAKKLPMKISEKTPSLQQDLLDQMKTPLYIFRYFQPKEEQES